MVAWQADLYRRPLKEGGVPLWELLLCSEDFQFTYGATVPQNRLDVPWVKQQLATALERGDAPAEIQVFRPQSLPLLESAAEGFGLAVVPRRHTDTLKRWLRQRAQWYPNLAQYSGEPYDPLALDRPPPVPLAENLWGEQWGFVAIATAEFERVFPHEPIPIRELPEARLPSRLGLPSTARLPGVVIDGGRRSMALAQWLQTAHPASCSYVPGEPDGLILEAGLVDRWVLTTFSDADVAAAGRQFMERRQACRGLHFLMVRPDASGVTHTGLWLLRAESN